MVLYKRNSSRSRPKTNRRATGGVSAFTFFGVAIGPAVFSGVLEFSGDYTVPLLILGIAALGPAILLMLKS